jgi:hypothetical protein
MAINQMTHTPQNAETDGRPSTLAEHADYVDAENLSPIIAWYRP